MALFVRRQHLAHARSVDGDRLLHEDVLPGLTAASKCIGRKPGGVARITRSMSPFRSLLVGVESDELVLVRHFHERLPLISRLVFDLALDSVLGRVDRLLEGVGQTNQSHVPFRAEGLHRGPATASAAADKPDIQGIAALCMAREEIWLTSAAPAATVEAVCKKLRREVELIRESPQRDEE